MRSVFAVVLSLASLAACHYTFPTLIVNGAPSGEWVNIRRTNNYNTQAPVTDVTSQDLRCYTSETRATATTVDVAAGSQLGIRANGNAYHQGVANIYMARAPSTAAGWDGSGNVWFKVHEVPAIANGQTITFPGSNVDTFTFTVPRNLPSGEYLVRIEQIALHSASSFGGAQFYISCAQVRVTGGGNGTPGPLVSIPGVYNGNEPGIKINIYWPIPTTYVQPGPAVWRG
ncbi:hypothetical protein NLJ89_g7112 [Agrocybe chaxingu]|uniref:lytic cellulose monooxygenase (C4-dehydrogenating) n=1 Tax=Agrocybe chaxingu TaxID=84603 RepID=A0A9W8JV51_9AGAR|nr:hypothetical protein NLJ89_g7112 [Agrocybe chaxingu]